MKPNERADLVGHLAELRGRLLRVLLYAVAGTVGVWVFFDNVYRFLVRPLARPLAEAAGELTVRGLLEGFLVRVEIAFVGGVIAASPFIFYEVWAFIAPGLTRAEQRAVRPLVPVSALLFLMGAGTGYLMTEPTAKWLLTQMPPDTRALLTLNETIVLVLKFYLAFGLGFQLPIVLVILAKLGIIDSALLTRRWREAVIGVFLLAAIITPTWDPITMTVCALPMVVLYIGTIGAIKLMERKGRKAREQEETPAG